MGASPLPYQISNALWIFHWVTLQLVCTWFKVAQFSQKQCSHKVFFHIQQDLGSIWHFDSLYVCFDVRVFTYHCKRGAPARLVCNWAVKWVKRRNLAAENWYVNFFIKSRTFDRTSEYQNKMSFIARLHLCLLHPTKKETTRMEKAFLVTVVSPTMTATFLNQFPFTTRNYSS